jgi:DNA modification methylase
VSVRILIGDCRDTLRDLPDGCVQTVVTSPPYFGLRDYGTGEWEGGDPACDHIRPKTTYNDGFNARWGNAEGQKKQETKNEAQFRDECGKCGARRVDRQIGLEPSPDEFVQALVGVFREVRRVLRDDGTVWLNLGDSYSGSGPSGASYESETTKRRREQGAQDGAFRVSPTLRDRGLTYAEKKPVPAAGTKPKDLIGIPWAVAFALRADGWYLRSDIIWSKPNPMPESVTDRPTKAHEYVFLLSKGPRYFYDADAIRETSGWGRENNPEWQHQRAETNGQKHPTNRNAKSGGFTEWQPEQGRNKRSVWTVATAPYPGAHFATFPPKLIEPCILAGSSPKACGVCGAPWQRVVERTTVRERLSANGDSHVVGKDADLRAQGSRNDDLNFSNSHNMSRTPEVRTVGWEPSCGHQDDTGQSVVLDPFAGSGTTGAVALEHGRAFIGCELNPAYGELIRDRLLSAPLALEGFGAA